MHGRRGSMYDTFIFWRRWCCTLCTKVEVCLSLPLFPLFLLLPLFLLFQTHSEMEALRRRQFDVAGNPSTQLRDLSHHEDEAEHCLWVRTGHSGCDRQALKVEIKNYHTEVYVFISVFSLCGPKTKEEEYS